MDELEHFFSGACGGICTVLVGHPLDTIKVRLQTMPVPKPGVKPLYTGTLDCFRKTIQYEGIRGLYKGMAAPLAGVTPIFAISFMGYQLGRRIFHPLDPHKPLSHLHLFIAGAFAGVFSTIIMAPGERIKSLLQIQKTGPKLYSGPIDCIKKIFQEGGIQGIYRGSLATLLRDIPASGMYFMTYEVLKDYFTNSGMKEIEVLEVLFAGSCAGITFWVVGMPADVLKSRIQTAPLGTYPNGIRDAFKELITVEGPAALYTGLIPVMLRAIPANAACFLGFELGKKISVFVKEFTKKARLE